MKKIEITTTFKKLMADVFTPVGIYLRLRDRFRDTILMESTDFHANDNSFSFIGINAIAGIEITNMHEVEYKFPGQKVEKINIAQTEKVPGLLWNFMQRFYVNSVPEKPVKVVQGLFGYTSFDAVQFFDTIKFSASNPEPPMIPLMRYRLYQYVIAINHFKDELYICENQLYGLESEVAIVESLIKSKDVPVFPFKTKEDESSNMTDAEYTEMVEQGIKHCHRGDVFQIVLSRRFQQRFTGDDFNVYRTLRNINPSPYLFYFDYGDYKLMGSSPESQLIIQGSKAVVHPIAGTFMRTGDDVTDKQLAEKLLADAKENAEHVMLVDLARNDLSRKCDQVFVSSFR
ncbi:MAG: chorismate-binding protein, partial [Chitinophagaceae bacterium]